ncbi:MAG: hypothetical protein KDD43_00650 [Bdellovibrionales bacterium]|nr:hypothetical protein [Bdellovibrionales bacterium]
MRQPAGEEPIVSSGEIETDQGSTQEFLQLALLTCKGCPEKPVAFTQQTLEHSAVHYSRGEMSTEDFIDRHARPRKKTSVFPPELDFVRVVGISVGADTWQLMGLQYDKSGGTKVKKSANYRALLSFPPSSQPFVAHIIVCLKAPCRDGDEREFDDNEVISFYPICGEGVVLVDARTPALKKLSQGKAAVTPRDCQPSDLKRFKN